MTPLNIAHRGGAALAPENTLASFRNGLALGVDALELDIHLTKDGVPVVMHDAMIDRTTNGSGRIANYTLAELQTFNAAAKFAGATSAERIPGSPEFIPTSPECVPTSPECVPTSPECVPTFAQVLDLAQPTSVLLAVEIKATPDGLRYPAIEQKALDEIGVRNMIERVRIMSFELDTLVRAKAIQPRVQTIALLSFGFLGSIDKYCPETVIAHVLSMDANGIGVSKDLLTPELVVEAHRRNRLVNVWTADTEADMSKFISMGVDSITTNRPDLLKNILGSRPFA